MLDILIPHFNDIEGLAASLLSISRQTWQGEMRIVLVDDGSRPEVQDVLRRMADSSKLNIYLQFNKKNRGRPYTRNVLLDSIDNKFVAWLDAGDEWYPRKLTQQFAKYAELEQTCLENLFWVTCNYDRAWSRRRKRPQAQACDQDQIRALLTGKSLLAYLWTLLGTAESFKSVGWFDERLPRLQDLDFFIRFILHGGVIKNASNKDQLCVYNKSDIGRDAAEIRLCNEHIFNKHRVLYNRYGYKFKRMRLFDMELLSARFAANNSAAKLKKYYLLQAFKHHPLAFVWRLYKARLKIV